MSEHDQILHAERETVEWLRAHPEDPRRQQAVLGLSDLVAEEVLMEDGEQ